MDLARGDGVNGGSSSGDKGMCANGIISVRPFSAKAAEQQGAVGISEICMDVFRVGETLAFGGVGGSGSSVIRTARSCLLLLPGEPVSGFRGLSGLSGCRPGA